MRQEVDGVELAWWIDIADGETDLEDVWGKSADEMRAESGLHIRDHEGRGASCSAGSPARFEARALSAPLVAVPTYHLAPGRVTRWPKGGYSVPSPYVDCLLRAGARAVLVTEADESDPAELLAPFQGLLLVGGGDVHPARYGDDPGPELYGVEPDRDRLEIDLLLAADRIGMPVLAICRGAQVANVAFGGTLHQHLPAMKGLLEHGVPAEGTVTIHDVKLASGSRIAKVCGSDVRFLLFAPPPGWTASGMDSSRRGGPPTASSRRSSASGWIVAVQSASGGHRGSDPAQQALFDAFAAETTA